MTEIFKILVDKSTITKIKRIGNIRLELVSKVAIDYPSLILIGHDYLNIEFHYIINYASNCIPDGLIDIVNSPNTISVSKNVELREMSSKDIDHDSNKDYTYGHVDTKVACRHCGGEFMFSELDDYCDDDHYLIDLCPHCEESNSVNYEYERLTDKECELIVEQTLKDA